MMPSERPRVVSDVAIPPEEVLPEEIEARGLSRKVEVWLD